MNIEKILEALNEKYKPIEAALKEATDSLVKLTPEAWEVKRQEELKKINDFLAILNSPEQWESKRLQEIENHNNVIDFWNIMLEMIAGKFNDLRKKLEEELQAKTNENSKEVVEKVEIAPSKTEDDFAVACEAAGDSNKEEVKNV